MDVRFISDDGVRSYPATELKALLDRPDGLVWVDVPTWDDQADHALTNVFGFHPLAIRDSINRNQVPKVHRYPDHFFVVLHAPQPGAHGHVHYVELDQFIGGRFLVTVHGPVNPAIDPSTAMVEVNAVLGRLESGKLLPRNGFELSFALLAALTARMRKYTAELTKDVWKLEQQVTGGHLGDPEAFLDEMFRVRHGLLTVGTMAALSREVYGRMVTIEAFGAGKGQDLLLDAVDQFQHLTVMAGGQKDYLQGTIEFYQARANTKMTIAAERLAVIAAVTLPITALSSDFRHERDRERTDAMGLGGRDPARDARHLRGTARLGETQRLVLTIAACTCASTLRSRPSHSIDLPLLFSIKMSHHGIVVRHTSMETTSARRVTRILGAVLVTTGALPIALTDLPAAAAAPCPDVEIVFARGTTEPPGVGGIGQAFVDSLRSQLGGRSVGVYAVNYPASRDFVNSTPACRRPRETAQ